MWISNFAVINVGDTGKIEVYASSATGGADVYTDVVGYYKQDVQTTTYEYTADGHARQKPIQTRAKRTSRGTNPLAYRWC